jgi:hypothetical protein
MHPSISSTLNVQILHTKVLFGSFFYLHETAKKRLYEKRARKTLMKLTHGRMNAKVQLRNNIHFEFAF